MVLLATRVAVFAQARKGGVHVQPVNNGRYAPVMCPG